MDISRYIKSEIYHYDENIKKKDTYRILNMVDIEQVDKNTTIIFTPSQECNVLYLPECYKNIEITINLSDDIDIELASPIPYRLKFKTVHQDCSFIIKYDYSKLNPIDYSKKLIDFLKLLPENTKSVKLYSNCSTLVNQDIIQYLPQNLKRYYTFFNYTESLDNLSQSLELLSVYPANPNYNYAFLPLTLHTLEIVNDNYYNSKSVNITLPELAHLPPGLKVLSLNKYTHNLDSLPEGLEKLLITNYHNLDKSTEFNIPPYLKTFQIYKWTDDNASATDYGYGINKYPANLEHLDIDCKVDITKLPATVKSLGLYGFNLSSNIIELPENIITIYTDEDFIEQLPAHIKRVIVVIKHPSGTDCSRVRVGDVLFEVNSHNTDECFTID